MIPGRATEGAPSGGDGPAAIGRDARRLAGRMLGAAWVVGGAFGLVGTLVPGATAGPASTAVVLVTALAALAAGAAFWRAPERVPGWLLAASPLIAALAVGGLNLATRDASTGAQLFLLWPVLFSASFLELRQTIATVALVIAIECVVMGVVAPPSVAIMDSASMAVVLGVSAVAVSVQRGRARRSLEALASQAREDSLTGLPNRRAFDERIEIDLAGSRRRGTPLSLILLDVDRFKEVNDVRGHLAGDAALRAVSEALRSATRQGDGLARLGGDEFAVLLVDCDAEDARGIARTLTAAVRLHARASADPITVSAGVATAEGGLTTPASLLAASDGALYQAKLGGGDRVEEAVGHPPAGAIP